METRETTKHPTCTRYLQQRIIRSQIATVLKVRNSELEDTEASLEVGPPNASPRNAEAQYTHCLGARDWTIAKHTPPAGTQERPDSPTPPQAGSLQPSQALSCPARRHQMPVLPDPVASHLRNVTGNSCCLPGVKCKLGTVPSVFLPPSVSTQQLGEGGIVTNPILQTRKPRPRAII